MSAEEVIRVPFRTPEGITQFEQWILTPIFDSVHRSKLAPIAEWIIEKVVRKEIVFTDSDGKEMNGATALQRLNLSAGAPSETITKNRLAGIITPFILDTKAFFALLDATGGERARELWEKALLKYTVRSEELGAFAPAPEEKRAKTKNKAPEQHKSDLFNLLNRYDLTRYYYSSDKHLAYYVHPAWAGLQLNNLLRDAWLTALKEPPEGAEVYSGLDFFQVVPSLRLLLTSDQIGMTAKGVATQAVCKKVAATVPLKPLPKSDSIDDKAGVWRMKVILTALHGKKTVFKQDIKKFLRELFSHTYIDTQTSPTVTYLNGVNYLAGMYEPDYYYGASVIAHEFLKQMPEGRWVNAKAATLGLRQLNLLSRAIESSSVYLYERMFRSGNITVADVVQGPLIGMLILYAAYGLVDLAVIDNGENDWLSGMDFYVRITEPGLYACERSNELGVATGEDNIKLFEIDSENLLIRSVANPNPLLALVASVSDKVEEGVYRPSVRRFVMQSGEESSFKTQMKNFSANILGQEAKHKEWKAFFKECESRIERAHLAKCERYALVEIDPTCAELVEFVTTSPIILRNTLKVEGNRLLMPPSFYPTFLDLMKRIGYIPQKYVSHLY